MVNDWFYDGQWGNDPDLSLVDQSFQLKNDVSLGYVDLLLGTVVSFTAQNFGILLLGRLIQGIGVGVSMPLLQTIMLSIFPPEKHGAAMGTVGLVIGLAPALGPTLSGWIVDNWTWRELFGMIIPIVVAVIILAFFFMKSVVPNTHQKIDVISIITSTIGFGGVIIWFF